MNNIKFNKKEIKTIAIAIELIDNSDGWTENLTGNEVDSILRTIETIKSKVIVEVNPSDEIDKIIADVKKSRFMEPHKLEKFTFINDGHNVGVIYASPLGNLTYAPPNTFSSKQIKYDLIAHIEKMNAQWG